MAGGGDRYAVFKEALDTYDTSIFQRDAFIDYIIHLGHLGGIIGPELQKRIIIKDRDTISLLLSLVKEAA
jgi:5'-nucleotidase/UDP-sugar diphosphatase